MKKPILTVLALIMLFTACTPAPAEQPVPTEPAQTAAAQLPSQAPDPVTPTAGSAVTAPYIDSRADYTYIMTDERDRKWEEDIVYFANLCLDPYNGHPKLSDRLTTTRTYNDLVTRYSTTSSENFFDPALKEDFIRGINELILSIPELSDGEIVFGLKRILAPLNDIHAGCSIGSYEDPLPIRFDPIEIGGTYEAVVFFAPKGSEDLLGARLKAINGVPLAEIIERLAPYFPRETDDNHVIEIISKYIDNCVSLRQIGVMGEETSAEFTFTDASGNELSRTLTSQHEIDLSKDCTFYSVNGDFIPADYRLMRSDRSVPAWYTLLMGGEALYFRLNTCMVDENFGSVVSEAFAAAAGTGKLKKVIVDFRHNGGGYLDLAESFIPLANAMRDSGAELFVLIDGLSYSASVAIPSMLKRRMENVTIVGSPAGQPVRFFFGYYAAEFTLPNSQLFCQCSRTYGDFWPEYPDGPLQPDITVLQTYEDFLAGTDSVLDYILNLN